MDVVRTLSKSAIRKNVGNAWPIKGRSLCKDSKRWSSGLATIIRATIASTAWHAAKRLEGKAQNTRYVSEGCANGCKIDKHQELAQWQQHLSTIIIVMAFPQNTQIFGRLFCAPKKTPSSPPAYPAQLEMSRGTEYGSIPSLRKSRPTFLTKQVQMCFQHKLLGANSENHLHPGHLDWILMNVGELRRNSGDCKEGCRLSGSPNLANLRHIPLRCARAFRPDLERFRTWP